MGTASVETEHARARHILVLAVLLSGRYLPGRQENVHQKPRALEFHRSGVYNRPGAEQPKSPPTENKD